MTFKNILVPTDGSEYTKAAINNAVEMAKNYGAKITALYVIDQTVFVNMPLDSAVMNTYTLLKKEGRVRYSMSSTSARRMVSNVISRSWKDHLSNV